MPTVQKDGPKKTIVTNFRAVCASMNRAEESVMDFFLKEYGTTGNLDGNQCLILRGVYKDTHIVKALRKYAVDYVMCQSCGRASTVVTRDPSTRLNVLTCRVCNAVRYVQSASAGFLAQTTRRSAQRVKQKF